jgi:hypothetical protein
MASDIQGRCTQCGTIYTLIYDPKLRALERERDEYKRRVERLKALQHAAKNVLDVSIATTAAVGGSPHVTSEGKLRIADALIALRNAVEALEDDDVE